MSSIRKNFLFNSILTISNYIFPIIVFPYITRVLGVHNIGICNFIDSIIQYFILFSFLGMQTMATREIAKVKDDSQKLSKTFISLLTINICTTVIALVILFFTAIAIPKFQDYKTLLLIGSSKIVANTLLVEWFFVGTENFKYITVRSIVIRFFYVISVFVFVKESSDYILYFTLTMLMFVVNAFINIVYVRKYVKFSLEGIEITTFLKPFFTLGAYQLLTSMYTSFNVAYLGFVSGETEVGYYTVATKIYSILLGVFTAFTSVMLPRMSSLIEQGNINEFKQKISGSVDVLLCFCMPVIVMATMYAPAIIRIAAGVGYEGSIIPLQIIIPLMLIIGYEQILVLQVLTPLNKDRAVLINSLVGATIGILLNILLVRSYGRIGSSVVWIISEISVLLMAQFFVSRFIQMHFPFKKYIKYITSSIPAFFLCWIIKNSLNSDVWSFIISSFVICLYFFTIYAFVIKNEHILYFIGKINQFKLRNNKR